MAGWMAGINVVNNIDGVSPTIMLMAERKELAKFFFIKSFKVFQRKVNDYKYRKRK